MKNWLASDILRRQCGYFLEVTNISSSLCILLMSFSDFLILPGFIDFTSDEVVSTHLCVRSTEGHTRCISVGGLSQDVISSEPRLFTFIPLLFSVSGSGQPHSDKCGFVSKRFLAHPLPKPSALLQWRAFFIYFFIFLKSEPPLSRPQLHFIIAVFTKVTLFLIT